jgi:hypothetical protein
MESGGANFRTRKLAGRNERLRFRPTLASFILTTVIVAAGVGALWGGVASWTEEFDDSWIREIFGIPFFTLGGLAILTGILILRASLRPIVFDRIRGYYWKGYFPPRPGRPHKNALPFSDIYAIQLVIRSSEMQNAELNLIYHQGSRLHVVSDVNRTKLKQSAQRLAEFLGVPLWNALPASPRDPLPTPARPPIEVDDPVAHRAQWCPIESGGANFITHRLREVSSDELAFRPVGWGLAIPWIFIISGSVAGIMLVVVNIGMFRDDRFSFRDGLTESLIYLVAPLLLIVLPPTFCIAGTWLLRRTTRPRRFDRSTDWYWTSRTPIRLATTDRERLDLDQGVPFAQIHALQLLKQYVSAMGSDSEPYYTYDLNLVLSDGRRLKVVGHGSERKLRHDAETLSEFLDVPLWDAT